MPWSETARVIDCRRADPSRARSRRRAYSVARARVIVPWSHGSQSHTVEGVQGDRRRRVRAEDVIVRSVDRRTFLTWAGKTSLAGMALLGAWGPVGVGPRARLLGGVAEEVSGRLPKVVKVGVIVPTSGIGQFLGDIVERSLGVAAAHPDAGLVKGVQSSTRS